MGMQNELIIPYLGLSNGSHEFFFELDHSFFSLYETSKVKNGRFEIKVDFQKQDRMVVLEIIGTGSHVAPCDRCLADIDVPMTFEDRVILKLTDVSDTDDASVHFLDPKTSKIDLSPYIYESIHLYLPLRNLRDCEGDDNKYCDQETLKNLSRDDEKQADQGNDIWKELGKLNLE